MRSFACPRRLVQRKHGPSVSLLSVSQSNYVRTSAEQSMQGSALNCFLIRSRRSTPSLSSAYHALQLMVRLHLPASVLHLPICLAATPFPISASAVLLLSLGPWPLSPETPTVYPNHNQPSQVDRQWRLRAGGLCRLWFLSQYIYISIALTFFA